MERLDVLPVDLPHAVIPLDPDLQQVANQLLRHAGRERAAGAPQGAVMALSAASGPSRSR